MNCELLSVIGSPHYLLAETAVTHSSFSEVNELAQSLYRVIFDSNCCYHVGIEPEPLWERIQNSKVFVPAQISQRLYIDLELRLISASNNVVIFNTQSTEWHWDLWKMEKLWRKKALHIYSVYKWPAWRAVCPCGQRFGLKERGPRFKSTQSHSGEHLVAVRLFAILEYVQKKSPETTDTLTI